MHVHINILRRIDKPTRSCLETTTKITQVFLDFYYLINYYISSLESRVK